MSYRKAYITSWSVKLEDKGEDFGFLFNKARQVPARAHRNRCAFLTRVVIVEEINEDEP